MPSRKRNDGTRSPAEADAARAEYPSILREYASSGFRDDSRVRVPHDLRPSPACRRLGTYRDRSHQDDVGAEDARERYGDGGPYWQRKG